MRPTHIMDQNKGSRNRYTDSHKFSQFWQMYKKSGRRTAVSTSHVETIGNLLAKNWNLA
jgi:hypothetical protein